MELSVRLVEVPLVSGSCVPIVRITSIHRFADRVGSEPRAVEGGWRLAWIFDGGFEGWLCPHTHASPEEAAACPDRASVLTSPLKH